jgi:prepilin peptidase CpaA
MIETALLLIFPAAVIFAGAMDIFSMTIPNKISLFLIASFACLAPFAGLSLEQFAWHVAAGLLVLFVTASMFFLGVMGGGDAKLVSTVALWLGFDHLMPYLLDAACLGGLLTLALLAVRSRPLPAMIATETWAQRLHEPRGGIPYGVALAVAAIAIYPETVWFTRIAT